MTRGDASRGAPAAHVRRAAVAPPHNNAFIPNQTNKNI